MRFSTLLMVCASTMLPVAALADWNPGEPHKMHYPQLPDPTGLDAYFTGVRLADDWQCSESGPVNDIHFWYSLRGDRSVPAAGANAISGVSVQIYSDIPVTPGGPNFSRPGQLLWDRNFSATDPSFKSRFYGSGQQGFYDPGFTPNTYTPNDHSNFYQINLANFDAPFIQTQGTIYWLALSVQTAQTVVNAGWKSSGSDQFNDTAVWLTNDGWQPIFDPRGSAAPVRLDLAFVITPTPSAAGVLGLGALVALRRRR